MRWIQAFSVQLSTDGDRVMSASATRIRLHAVRHDLPCLAQILQEGVGQDLAALIELEQPGFSLEEARRPREPRLGEEGRGRAVARSEPRSEALRQHAVVQCLTRARRLVIGERDRVGELPGAQIEHPRGRGRRTERAHDSRRVPALGHAVGCGQPEARLQLDAGGERRDEVAPADAAPRLRRRQGRGQDRGVGVHTAGIVIVVEVQRVRGCAVGERGCRRRDASLADEHRRRATALPAEKEAIDLRNAGGVSGGGDHAKGVQHEELDSLHHRRGEARETPVLVGGHHLAAEPVGGLRRNAHRGGSLVARIGLYSESVAGQDKCCGGRRNTGEDEDCQRDAGPTCVGQRDTTEPADDAGSGVVEQVVQR